MLQAIKHLILDMDGVLWKGTKPLVDLPAFFDGVGRLGLSVAFATNNASRTPEEYVAKFRGFGVAIDSRQVMTSGVATAQFLARHHDPGRTRVYVVGSDSLRQMLVDVGLQLLPRWATSPAANIVVVGLTDQVTYEDFATATIHLRQHQADFVGCNPDTTFPSERGLLPGNGALLALLEASGGRRPTIIDKPQPRLFNACLVRLGDQATPDNTLVVGDRLGTDIAGGRQAGFQTALVLSGVTVRTELADTPYPPDHVFEDLDELLSTLQAIVPKEEVGR